MSIKFEVEMLGGPFDGTVYTLPRFASYISLPDPERPIDIYEGLSDPVLPFSRQVPIIKVPVKRLDVGGKYYAVWKERGIGT